MENKDKIQNEENMSDVAGGKTHKIINWVNGVLWRVCTECRICYENCPAGAISFVNGAASIDKDKCVGCNACYYTCPEHCINPDKLKR